MEGSSSVLKTMKKNKESLTESPICEFSITFDCTPLNYCLNM